MATTISESAFQTALSTAADYVLAGSYKLAKDYITQAEIINAGLPYDVGDAGASARRRESLDKILKMIDDVEASASKNSDTYRIIGVPVRGPR